MLVGLLFVVIGPIAARMVAMAASRTREYLADAGGAIFTRNPEALASALEKISTNARGHRLPLPRAAQPMLIVGASLFSTHPPVDKRIAVLRAMAGVGGGLSIAGYARGYRSIVGGSTSFIPSVGFVAAPSPSSARGPAAHETRGALRREALDALKRSAGYRSVHCPCSAVIKVPATFPRGRSATCVSCGRKLSVDSASE
jgi:heat shock protein HtpX